MLAGFVTARQLGFADVVLTLLNALLGPLLLALASRSLFESATCAHCPRGPRWLVQILATGRLWQVQSVPVRALGSGELLPEVMLGMSGRRRLRRRSGIVAEIYAAEQKDSVKFMLGETGTETAQHAQ